MDIVKEFLKQTDIPKAAKERQNWIIENLKDCLDKPYKLYPYQKAWLNDDSRFKIILKARQIGFSWTIALEALFECFLLGHNCLIASASQQQADEVMEKLKDHYWSLKELFSGLKEKGDSKSELKINFMTKDNSLSKTYKKIISLPENPRTVQGFTGTVFLDEFAHHQRADKMYKALVPSITRSKDFKLRVISTPAGKSGKFYDLWTGNNDFRKCKVNIHDAIRQGYKVDINELKRNLSSDDFAESYLCEFLDSNYSYFSLDLIEGCVSERLNRWDNRQRGDFYLGVDIGRKKDLTALVLLERLEETLYMRDLITLKNKKFEKQKKIIEKVINNYKVRVCAVDSTGLGMQLSEELKKAYGQRIEEISFTANIKEKLVTDLKIAFEDKAIKIMPNKELIEDIHSIKRSVTSAGNVRYEGSNKDSHADRFWALALANYATDLSSKGKIEWQGIGQRVFNSAKRFVRGGYGS